MSPYKAMKEVNHEVPFRLESVARTTSPEGSDGVWYRYVIAQGTNQITGTRCGTEAEVNHMLRDMVERLNERRAGKNRPKGRPAAATTPSSPAT